LKVRQRAKRVGYWLVDSVEMSPQALEGIAMSLDSDANVGLSVV
jgi:hypothetical protein